MPVPVTAETVRAAKVVNIATNWFYASYPWREVFKTTPESCKPAKFLIADVAFFAPTKSRQLDLQGSDRLLEKRFHFCVVLSFFKVKFVKVDFLILGNTKLKAYILISVICPDSKD